MELSEPRHEKTGFCLFKNKGADQLRSNCEADQHLCFHYTDSTILLNPKFQASSLLLRLYRPICVRTGRKPRRLVFSHRGSSDILTYDIVIIYKRVHIFWVSVKTLAFWEHLKQEEYHSKRINYRCFIYRGKLCQKYVFKFSCYNVF